jgi:hypothetical protein
VSKTVVPVTGQACVEVLWVCSAVHPSPDLGSGNEVQ